MVHRPPVWTEHTASPLVRPDAVALEADTCDGTGRDGCHPPNPSLRRAEGADGGYLGLRRDITPGFIVGLGSAEHPVYTANRTGA